MCSFLAVHINEINLAFFLAYRPPPKYDSDRFRGPHLESSFNKIIIKNIESTIIKLGTPPPDIILAGDFNFPKAIWSSGIGLPPNGNSSESQMLTSLISLTENHHLLQVIDFGTRPNPSGSSNPLDLIFTNNDQIFSQITHSHTALSDHLVIECHTRHHLTRNTPHSPPTSSTNLSSFNMHKADWDPINQSIRSFKWENEIESRNMNEFSLFLLQATMNSVRPHCPEFRNKPGSTKNKIPRDRRILFRQRKKKKNAATNSPNI